MTAFVENAAVAAGLLCAPKRLGIETRSKRRWTVRSAIAEGPPPTGKVNAMDMDAYVRGFESVDEEALFEVDATDDTRDDIEGSLPEDLKGTLFRVMPGRSDAQGVPLDNYFDGDGMVVAVSFDGKKVFVRNRFIKTKAFEREKRAKKMLYRGMYGSKVPGGALANFAVKVKQAANRFAVYHGRRLLCLHDWGTPYSVDPTSLLTRGRTNVRTEILNSEKMIPSARFDASTGNVVLATKSFLPVGMELSFKEYNDDYRVQRKRKEIVRASGLVQDFGLTKSSYILFQAPYSFDSTSHLFGVKSRYQDALSKSGTNAEILVIPRDDGRKVEKFRTESVYVGRIANSYDCENGDIVIDAVQHDALFLGDGLMAKNYGERVPRSSLVRYVLRQDGTTQEVELLHNQVDYPTTSPTVQSQRHTYIYAVAAEMEEVSPPRGIAKIDCDTKSVEKWIPESASSFCSAPVFVPRRSDSSSQAEDDGYIVTMLYDGADNASKVAVLDAQQLTKGPLCLINLQRPYPHGLTSTWTSDTFSMAAAQKTNSFEIFKNKGWNQVDSGFSLMGLQ
eukprot:CAMPEP_0198729112 /NCGR_PEP_ID=MMETSP1475-20131203/14885_1 /TAXON_ID= ORGANISM="Unidentified sp., Strain CCMP1999" /NCGR_SAMPLE_ID=MMETSP1475 /ASSEMBLY_ACC=CAM_ASM_001111 /LENGTH=561 /DNA_ID=CAMNT_0044491681 /DNA_START=79 /DNA_END=1761 /DNA_ORIENTATION=+